MNTLLIAQGPHRGKTRKSSSWLLLLEYFRFISMEMEWGGGLLIY
jgi:hypothetical protein